MNTFLFYLEPFPIRNSYYMFRGLILQNFANAILNVNKGNNPLIYGNKQTLYEIYKSNPKFGQYFLVPTQEEQEIFEGYFCDWDSEGISKWKGLYTDSEISNVFMDIILQIYSRQKFDYIICWGTNTAVKKAAKKLNIGFINMELGPSRLPYMDSFVIDPEGVNGASFLSGCRIDDLPDMPIHESIYDLYKSMNFNSRGYQDRFNYISETNFLNIDLSKIKKIYVIALQLYDDANMLFYSPFNSIKEFLEEVLPNIEKESLCIIKEHPASSLRNGSTQENLKAKIYASEFKNVLWLDSNDTFLSNARLIQISDCVITINSSFGFEALLYDKPVIVYGDAVYKPKNTFPTFLEYVNNNYDHEDYLKKINKIRNFFLYHYLISRETVNNSDLFFDYLKFVGNLSLKYENQSNKIENYINDYINFSSVKQKC